MPDERWTVLVTEPIDEAGLDLLSDFATVVRGAEYDGREALLADAERFDGIVVRSFAVDAELLDRTTRLKVISKHGVGIDNVDVDAASERDVPVCRVLGANDREVAEHALLLIMALRRRLTRIDRDTRRGVWDRSRYETHTVGEDTLGLYGCGSIGRHALRFARGLGLDCAVYDPYVDPSDLPEPVEAVDSTRSLFEAATVVSIHAPLTDETRGDVGEDELARLGDGGLLVNTSRGEIVDEAALIAALEAGTIGGAGLDVLETEPPAPDNPLLHRDDVVVTPHVAGNTVESLRKLGAGAAENVRAVYEGRLPEATVNADRVGSLGNGDR